MLPILLIFLALSVLPIWFNLMVLRRYRVRKGLRERGRRAVAKVVDVGNTMGGLAVSSTIVHFAHDVDGVRFETRVVVTGGVSRPEKGQTIDIVYLPDMPKHADIVGNPGNFATFVGPLVGLNLLWLGAGFGVILEVVERMK